MEPKKNQFFHGTTHEAAAAIEKEGFKLPKKPAASGPGIYLTSDPEVAKSYGPAVVKVKVPGRIASAETSLNAEGEATGNARMKKDLQRSGAWSRKEAKNYPETQEGVLKSRGFKGRTDYDDGAKVVFDPEHAKFDGHYDPKAE